MSLLAAAFLADPGLVKLLPRVAALSIVQANPVVVLERIAALAPR